MELCAPVDAIMDAAISAEQVMHSYSRYAELVRVYDPAISDEALMRDWFTNVGSGLLGKTGEGGDVLYPYCFHCKMLMTPETKEPTFPIDEMPQDLIGEKLTGSICIKDYNRREELIVDNSHSLTREKIRELMRKLGPGCSYEDIMAAAAGGM